MQTVIDDMLPCMPWLPCGGGDRRGPEFGIDAVMIILYFMAVRAFLHREITARDAAKCAGIDGPKGSIEDGPARSRLGRVFLCRPRSFGSGVVVFPKRTPGGPVGHFSD